MFVGGGEDEEGFLFDCDHDLGFAGGVVALEVVDFAFSEDEGLGLHSPLLEGDPACHVLDVLHDEVHGDAVVSKPRNDNVCIHSSWKDKVAECLLHELIVLLQHADHASSSLSCVSLQSSAQADVICINH